MIKKILTLLLLGFTTTISAQSYGDIYSLIRQNESVRGIRSMSDGENYTVVENNSIVKYKYAKENQGDVILPTIMGKFSIYDYQFSPNENSLLVAQGAVPIYRHSYKTNYHLMEHGKGLQPILGSAKAPRDATFSPNGEMLAYSDENNLYIYDIEQESSCAITSDGEWNEIINGTTDWVYEEEFGFTKAYAFSPDSRQIAYLRFDETDVPMFEMMRYDQKLYNKAYSFKYPKAGDQNSTVELWVYDVESKTKKEIEVGSEKDQYIPHLGWTPAGELYYYRLNRRQNHFETILIAANGDQSVIYEEKSPQYVERVNSGTIQFIDDDRFIVKEETTAGYMHLYMHSIKDGRLYPITKGDWDVTSVVSITDKDIYYMSAEDSPLRRNMYNISIDGDDKERLTQGDGYYSIAPSAGMKYYISTFSNTTTPNHVAIYNGKGKLVRNLKNSEKLATELAEGEQPIKEFFTMTTERGDLLNGYRITPRDFDQTKRYPVLMSQYSGPGSQQVLDRWSLGWEDAVVAAGYIVVCVDGRGTGGRGEKFKKCTYGDLGRREVEDQISVAKWLTEQPFVDASRIGIYGWSYGGFMALGCAFKGEGLFKMSIAVAPVTSWRYYDTIYTEIYNDLPQNNPAGYDDNSPINFAEMLDDSKTRLLIIHGTADDNVHIQNSMEMMRALDSHGKIYDTKIYPDQNHSMQPNRGIQVRDYMINYTLKNL